MTEAVQLKRKDWLDALRGIAIIMVVLVHTIPAESHAWYVYNVLIGPIMIPMFFAISGYFFNGKNGKQRDFYYSMLRKIIVPTIIFGLLPQLRLILSVGLSSFFTACYQLLSGELFWYISACIIAEIVFFYILKFCKKTVVICLAACLCCVAGFLMNHWGVGHFGMVNRGFIAQFFLLIGFMFRKNEEKLRRLGWPVIFAAGLIYIVMIGATYYCWPGQSIDVHKNRYYHIPYCLVLILVSCFFMMMCASRSKKTPKALALIGRHTLLTYLLHGLCLALGNRFLPMTNADGIELFVKVLMISAGSVLACTVFGMLVNLWLPEVLGRTRHRKKC